MTDERLAEYRALDVHPLGLMLGEFVTEIDALKAELAAEKLVAQKAREHIGNLLIKRGTCYVSAMKPCGLCNGCAAQKFIAAHLSEECPNCANHPHAGPCSRSHAKDGHGNRTPNAEGGNSR